MHGTRRVDSSCVGPDAREVHRRSDARARRRIAAGAGDDRRGPCCSPAPTATSGASSASNGSSGSRARVGGSCASCAAPDAAEARQRIVDAFDTGDAELLSHFTSLAEQHLEVLAGDLAERHLGLDHDDLATACRDGRRHRASGCAGQPRAALLAAVRPERRRHGGADPACTQRKAQAIRQRLDGRGRPSPAGGEPIDEDADVRIAIPTSLGARRRVRQRLRDEQVGGRGTAARRERALRHPRQQLPFGHDPRAQPLPRPAERAGHVHSLDLTASCGPGSRRARSTAQRGQTARTTTACRSISRQLQWLRSASRRPRASIRTTS